MIAFTREVSPRLGDCELTHIGRAPINVVAAREQHRRYEAMLARLGCDVRQLPELPDAPDGVFVEDAAVVFDELAVVTRPGVESRRGEVPSVAAALAEFRPLHVIHAPATLDGGDVLVLGRRVFVGASGRTNAAGIDRLRAILAPHGYAVTAVPLAGCLHLKTAVARVADGTLLVNRAWLDPAVFGDVEVIDVDPAEPFAANALPIGGAVVYPAAFSRTRERLERRGLRVETVDMSELAKAEGGVTCCCVLVE
jgi:dimethylargininase